MNRAPTKVKTRTMMDPACTRDLAEEFIITAPTIIKIPLTSPIPPMPAMANPAILNPGRPEMEPRNATTTATSTPISR